MTLAQSDGASPIRVLVVDDSVVVRRAIAIAIEAAPGVELAGTAANGRLALEKIASLRPDAVVLDLEMPEMGGLEALARIRASEPNLPVVIFSYIRPTDASEVMDALSTGRTEFVLKPTAADGIGLARDYLQNELIPVIVNIVRKRAAGGMRWVGGPGIESQMGARAGGREGVAQHVAAIVIAISTGGPTALEEVLSALSAPLPVPILIVQHMPAMFTRLLAQRLDRLTPATVTEATHGQLVAAGEVLIAPGDQHMEVARNGAGVRIELGTGPKENFCRPSADVLFRSAARVYGSGTLAVVMTGMGQDGARGARDVLAAGGSLIAQAPETATIPTMPAAVADIANAVVGLDQIAAELTRRTARDAPR